MNRNPCFLTLALFSWFFSMLASVLFGSAPVWQEYWGLAGLVPMLAALTLTAAGPWPEFLCSAAMCAALLWRMKGRGLTWPLRFILTAATLLPTLFFLLASVFMGPVSATMIFGLGCLLVALPIDACLNREESK